MLDAPKADGTVGKALQVLDQVADFKRPVRFSELLAHSPFPKPSLYRFVQTLTNQGMLHFDSERQTYSVGVRLMRLAHSAWRHNSLAPIAQTHLDQLAAIVAGAVHLAQIDNGHVLFVDKRIGTDQFETLAQAGRVAPCYCTGVGKAILASLSGQQRERVLEQQSYARYTPATLTSRSALEQELETIVTQGVAFDREEHERGIISIAAPILTQNRAVVGAVSIASSTAVHSLDDLKTFQPELLKTARLIGDEVEIWQAPTWG